MDADRTEFVPGGREVAAALLTRGGSRR